MLKFQTKEGEMKFRFFSWLAMMIFLFNSQLADAQILEDKYFLSQVDKGMSFTYNLQFEKAAEVYLVLQGEYPDHPGPHFMQALNRWWQSYISTTTHYHEYVETQLDKALLLNKEFKDKPELELEYTFFQYMSYAFKSRLYILRREWFNAANAGRKALPFLKDGLGFTDQSPEFYFSSGIYHYYADVYPQDHGYVRPFMIFFPSGDSELGLREMELAANLKNFAQTEAQYYLSEVYIEEEKDYPKAVAIKKKLVLKYPNNTWFQADYVRALIFDEQYEKAENLVKEMRREFEKNPEHAHKHQTSLHTRYTTQLMVRNYLYQGIIFLQAHNDTELALSFFQKSLKMAEISNLRDDDHLPAVYYYMGICYEKMGDFEKAMAAYKEALSLEDNREVKEDAKKRLAALRK